MLSKPMFIVFEGIDGSGKSTQARRLADYMRSISRPVTLTAEPSNSPAGLKIKSLTSRLPAEVETELFIEDRRHHVQNVIKPALSKGFDVICDRYVYSSAAYQGSCGISPKEIMKRNFEFAPRPDITFLIEIPLEVAIQRIQTNRKGAFSVFEKLESLKLVDLIYRGLNEKDIKRVDGTQDEETVHRYIIEIVQNLIDMKNP